jgi:hypothetical protein
MLFVKLNRVKKMLYGNPTIWWDDPEKMESNYP